MTEHHDDAAVRGLLTALRERVDVSPPPVADVMGQGEAVKTRRRTVVGGVAAAAVLAVLGLVVRDLAQRNPDVIAPAPAVGVAWWSEGTLHSAYGDASVAGVVELVDVPGGVVVLIEDGSIERVDADGRTALGSLGSPAAYSAGPRVVLDEGSGLVAWVRRTAAGDQVVEVVRPAGDGDLASRRVARHRIDTAWPDPVTMRAFEDGVVYYDQRDGGDRAWHVDTDRVERLGTGASYVMDVEDDLMVTMRPDGSAYQLRSGGVVRWTTAVQALWRFSTDARWLVAVPFPGAPAERASPVRVFDTRTGEEVPTGLPVGSVVAGVSLRPDSSLVYGVAESSDGPFDLVACQPATGVCTTLVEDAAGPDLVLPLG